MFSLVNESGKCDRCGKTLHDDYDISDETWRERCPTCGELAPVDSAGSLSCRNCRRAPGTLVDLATKWGTGVFVYDDKDPERMPAWLPAGLERDFRGFRRLVLKKWGEFNGDTLAAVREWLEAEHGYTSEQSAVAKFGKVRLLLEAKPKGKGGRPPNTERNEQVNALRAEGWKRKRIAEELGITVEEVSNVKKPK